MCRQIVFPMPTRVRERAINGGRTGNIFDSFRHFGFPGKPGRILLRMPFQTFKNDQKVRIGRGKNSPSFRRLRAKKRSLHPGTTDAGSTVFRHSREKTVTRIRNNRTPNPVSPVKTSGEQKNPVFSYRVNFFKAPLLPVPRVLQMLPCRKPRSRRASYGSASHPPS